MTRKRTAPMPSTLVGRPHRTAAVPCNGCTACCRDNLIALFPDEGDDLARYGDAVEWAPNPLNGETSPFMKHRRSGECVQLGPDGCQIYDHRPAVCRAFDCRVFYREFKAHCSKVQIKQAMRRGGLSRDVFLAGKERQ